MTNTYIYIRFSDDKQAQGTSYERQLDRAKEYCIKHGLTFIDDPDHIFFDAGKSAFKGEHISEGGELKRFYDLVANKTIPSGSKLLVENLDRLSRAGMWKASDKFRELTDAGIVVVTLMDGKEWTGLGGIGDAMMSLIQMDLAHQESAKKSDRVGKSWTQRYKLAREGKPIKLPLASWLAYGKSGFTVLREPEASVVQEIFKLCIEGYGSLVIAKTLNEKGYKPFRGDRWITATISSILKNKATMGLYTPRDGGEPIENYFAAAVDSDTYWSAQTAIAGRKKAVATRQTKAFNVWQGIAKCGVCGFALHCLPKGKGGQHYLVCSGKLGGKCTKAKNVRLDRSELVFKEILAQVDSLSLIQEEKAQTAKELAALEGRIADQSRQHQELGAAMERRYTQQLDDLAESAGQRLENLKLEKSILEAKLSHEAAMQKDKVWFFDQLDLITYGKRQQANALLKRLEIKVVVFGGMYATYITRRRGEAVLQITESNNGLIVLPLVAEQRIKNAELDPHGTDVMKATDWINQKLGINKIK